MGFLNHIMWLVGIAGVACAPGTFAGQPGTSTAPQGPMAGIDFNRDVRPILSENCFFCHGPDKAKRKADYRLDTREGALAKLTDGVAIIPGNPEKSVLLQRITSDDDEERMPPVKSEKRLSAAQIQILKQWIAEGAEYKPHWSYIPTSRPPTPATTNAAWIRNPIDAFIAAKLDKEKLSPSTEAERSTLIRRLSLDIIGLPPTPAEVDAFVADRGADAYEKAVDRLLASPHFGERMAIHWLDLVRFADTIGYHSDNPRNIAPYRDYVIQAFNENMPFDRFTTEQLAGDLMTEPTLRQQVASGYNRLLMTTEEGGAQAKEYEAKYAADRVRNFTSVWMGATVGCAECHDHKYDPYTAKDFYRLAAFFADVKEGATGKREDGMPVPDDNQSAILKGVDEKLLGMKAELNTPLPSMVEAQKAWEAEVSKLPPPTLGIWQSIGPFTLKEGSPFATVFEPEKEVDLKKTYNDGALKWKAQPKWEDGKVFNELKGDLAANYLYRTIDVPRARELTLSLGSDDGIKVWINGAEVLAKDVARGAAADQEKITVPLKAGKNALLMKISNTAGLSGFYFKAEFSGEPPATVKLILTPEEKRTPAQKTELATYYASAIAPERKDLRAAVADLEKTKAELLAKIPKTLVTMAASPRKLRVLARGNWMDETGEIVEPGVPHFLEQIESGGKRATRLELARWLVDPKNPLTARVFVNRLWKMYFGMGISKALDDLGSQGEWPSHPELLDWLAAEFSNGWDVKKIVRTIVMSSTYRQSSAGAKALRERDPYNRLLARQTAFRMDAELVRDNALAISGLLSSVLGGESVKPHQPPGYWSFLNFPTREYVADSGEKLYRRGLYTFWQRTFPHPSLLAFDAPSREECTAERTRSNTPLQALALLNDPTYVEAARSFAMRIIVEGGDEPPERIRWAFKKALGRAATAEETRVVTEMLNKHLAQYGADAAAAQKLAVVPTPVGKEAEKPGASDVTLAYEGTAKMKKVAIKEFAAWISVARVILNLHETITRN